MTITVNGDPRQVVPGRTLQDLLNELDVDGETVVVERNLEVLNHPRFADTPLQEGDVLEIVRFIGGG